MRNEKFCTWIFDEGFDEKVKHMINENAGWVVNAVPVIYDRMAEVVNQGLVDVAGILGETQGMSSAEILSNFIKFSIISPS